ncbi:MAG: hypothetical protein Q8S56_02105, partial [Polaromonas sp.]|nr:hypothetical protein [Polaromonas sp.]
ACERLDDATKTIAASASLLWANSLFDAEFSEGIDGNKSDHLGSVEIEHSRPVLVAAGHG